MTLCSSSRTALAFLVCLVTLAGCQSGVVRVPVQGKVTLAGSAVTDATIQFEGDGGRGGLAEIGDDGTYEIKTFEGAGLPPGTYRVAITPGRIMKPGEIPLVGKETPRKPVKNSPIPDKYHKTATSQLTAEVKAGENKPFDFALSKDK